MINADENLNRWMMDSDPAIKWQYMKDILGLPPKEYEPVRKSVSETGWGKMFLDFQDKKYTWGGDLYSPKWISTTYTLLTLKYFGIEPDVNSRKGCSLLIDRGLYRDGGINYFGSINYGEQCVTAMVASLMSHFTPDDDRIHGLVEFLSARQMADGGWNCQSPKGHQHSSMHTTISILECMADYNNTYGQQQKLNEQILKAVEFVLQHRLFKSDKTGNIIDQKYTRFSFPPRWRYDIMRMLEFSAKNNLHYDERYSDAVELFLNKRNKDRSWNVQQKYSGRVFFDMEKTGKPSKWNTLRGMRILKWLNDKI